MSHLQRTCLRWCAVLSVMWCTGCAQYTEPSQLGFRIEFASSGLREAAHAVRAEIARGGCDGERVFSAMITPGADAESPDALARGTYGFMARARDASCRWVAEGCTVVELPHVGDVVVVLEAMKQAELDPTCEESAAPTDPWLDGGTSDEDDVAVDGGGFLEGPDGSVAEPSDDAGQSLPTLRVAVGETFDLGRDGSAGRGCADGVASQVVSLTALRATLAAPVAGDCFAAGDEALLINLQGAPGATVNVGAYELVRVTAATTTSVTFAAPHVRAYGAVANSDEGIGAEEGEQRVALIRVPRYADVVVPEGAVLTTGPWNGALGGVLALRSTGTVRIDGEVRGNGLGFRGGSSSSVAGASGRQGESIAGAGIVATEAHVGGGGGGTGDLGAASGSCAGNGAGGGGGGHVSAGAPGSALCAGQGGEPFHLDGANRLFLGAGGGSGGTDNDVATTPVGGAGGHGGAIMLLVAPRVVGAGLIAANGLAGQGTPPGAACSGGSASLSCWDYAGPGGGGAGGSVLLLGAPDATPVLSAAGGNGGDGLDARAGDGGRGGAGFLLATEAP